MKLALRRTLLLGSLAGAALTLQAYASTSNSTPLAPDTILDASYVAITAEILGCSVDRSDLILLNGTKPDGTLWDLSSVTPERAIEISPADRKELGGLGRPLPTMLPEIRIRILPGYYDFGLTIGRCRLAPIPLIAADARGNRTVTLIRQDMISKAQIERHAAQSAGFYGELPVPDANVTLTRLDSRAVFVARTVDNLGASGHHYMFFFDAVPPGRYGLGVNGFGWTKDLGEFNLREAGRVQYRNVTLSDLGLNY